MAAEEEYLSCFTNIVIQLLSMWEEAQMHTHMPIFSELIGFWKSEVGTV